MPIVQSMVKRVAGGVGFVSEGITQYRHRKDAPAPASATAATTAEEKPSDRSDGYEEDDEGLSSNKADELPTSDGLAKSFLNTYSTLPNQSLDTAHLEFPVVIPQRRPKDRSRGFANAYAPALAEFGIDEHMFLDFLDDFSKASRAKGWLNAINLAAIGTATLPHFITFAVSRAIQVSTDAAIEADVRYRANTFLDKINKDFFMPRGLFCLVMTWNPNSNSPITRLDLSSSVSGAVNDGGPDVSDKMKHKMRSSDATTSTNEFPFPETAPLVFFDDEELAAHREASNAEQRGGMGKFMEDYRDRRAQAQFTMENPDTPLPQGPEPKFTSRYADPSNPASSGSILGLVSGGHLKGRRERRAEASGYGPQKGRKERRQDRREAQGRTRPVKQFLKKNVLYLAIVNMPSEEEMHVAQEEIGFKA